MSTEKVTIYKRDNLNNPSEVTKNKIYLINSKHNILSLASIKENIPDITISQYEHLCASLVDITPEIEDNILSKIKPDFLTESL